MSAPFDPYHKWLGIPPSQQPPTHYRLLGLEQYESDPDVIDAAANQRMSYLQDLAVGERVKESQKLLNEVAVARRTLLNKDKKAEYDADLRAASAKSAAAPIPIIPQPYTPPPIQVPYPSAAPAAAPPITYPTPAAYAPPVATSASAPAYADDMVPDAMPVEEEAETSSEFGFGGESPIPNRPSSRGRPAQVASGSTELAEPKKSSKKWLFIGGGAAVLFGFGAVAVALVMMNQPSGESTEVTETKPSSTTAKSNPTSNLTQQIQRARMPKPYFDALEKVEPEKGQDLSNGLSIPKAGKLAEKFLLDGKFELPPDGSCEILVGDTRITVNAKRDSVILEGDGHREEVHHAISRDGKTFQFTAAVSSTYLEMWVNGGIVVWNGTFFHQKVDPALPTKAPKPLAVKITGKGVKVAALKYASLDPAPAPKPMPPKPMPTKPAAPKPMPAKPTPPKPMPTTPTPPKTPATSNKAPATNKTPAPQAAAVGTKPSTAATKPK